MVSKKNWVEKAERTPLEGSAKGEAGATLSFGEFSCSSVRLMSDEGASGLVYSAISDDYYGESGIPAKLIVKECYPIEISDVLVREDDRLFLPSGASDASNVAFSRAKKSFADSFVSHATLYQGTAREQVVAPCKAYEENGTCYLVSDASNGDTMTEAFDHMGSCEQVRTLVRVCEALMAIHESGYAYLDLKPDNILCLRNADSTNGDRYSGEIKLFDFDTVTPLEYLGNPDRAVSGSGGWSAYEQIREGYRDKIGIQSDIYAVGALLFWVVVGRPPQTIEVIHADGHWALTGKDCCNADLRAANELTWRLIRKILNGTLTVDSGSRYPSVKALADDLAVLNDSLLPVSPTHSAQHAEMMGKLDSLASLTSVGIESIMALLGMASGAARAAGNDGGPLESSSGSESLNEGKRSEGSVEETILSLGVPYYMLRAFVAESNRVNISPAIRSRLSACIGEIRDSVSCRDSESLARLAEESQNLLFALISLVWAPSDIAKLDDTWLHACQMLGLENSREYQVALRCRKDVDNQLVLLHDALVLGDVDEMMRVGLLVAMDLDVAKTLCMKQICTRWLFMDKPYGSVDESAYASIEVLAGALEAAVADSRAEDACSCAKRLGDKLETIWAEVDN